jgi:tetratricopeptide (TPR) repeat protein
VSVDPELLGRLKRLVQQQRLEDAEEAARSALRTHPTLGFLWKILSVVRVQQHKDALPELTRAAELLPHDAETLGNLGSALLARGRWLAAMPYLERALHLAPNDAGILVDMADCLRATGKSLDAVALYLRAAELEPNRAELQCSLGNALLEARKVDAAMAHYRQALALRPDHAPAHLGEALVFRQQRRSAHALAACRAALTTDPDFPEALAILGELEADEGRFETAETLFRRALHIEPGLVMAISGIAAHRRMTPADSDWLRRATTLAASGLPLAEEITLRFALGKYFDDVREFDQAFTEYHRANELCKRHGPPYEPDAVTQRVEEIIDHVGDMQTHISDTARSDSPLPIVIIGMPRSGTSLAEQILAAHPEVCGGGEVVFWSSAYETYRDAKRLGQSAADLIPGFAADYVGRLRSLSNGAARIVDKMPVNFMYAGLIHAALPRARIIHMCRHPIDTCLSIYFQNFFNIGPYANDLNALAHYYGEYRRITQAWRTLLPASALLEVPYEGLVTEQERWTRRMLEFVGLPWDPGCLDFHRAERAVITASRWQVRQPIHTGSTARWRHYERHVSPLKGLLDDGRAAECAALS